jgi:hypothetical protein
MNHPELNSILKKARTPERPEEYFEAFPRRVTSRLNRSRTQNNRGEAQRLPRFALGFAITICIFTAFAIGHWRGQTETKTFTSNDVLQNPKLIRETLAMFPNQVRAIVQDERGLNVVLSENDNVPASTPIYVRICDGKQCASAVTFSGQEIQIAGQKMTILSDVQGGIILMGNDFVWSSRAPSYAKNDLKIEVRNLSSVAM